MRLLEILFPQPLLYDAGVSLSPGNRQPNFSGVAAEEPYKPQANTGPDSSGYELADDMVLAPYTIIASNSIVTGFNDGGVLHFVTEGSGDH